MKPVAFVTGATGFVGSHIVESLLARNYSVRCLVRASSDLRWIQHLPVERVVSTLEEPDRIVPYLQNVTYVFHLAGLTKAKRNKDYYHINAGLSQNLLDACLASETTLDRFVLCSSQAAGGPGAENAPKRTNNIPRPKSVYGKSKLEAERIAQGYFPKLPVTIVRPPAVYGPRDTDVFAFFKMVNMGISVNIGRKERYYNFIHVKDLAEAIIDAAEKPATKGKTYYLADPNIYSWSRIIQEIGTALKKKPFQTTLPAGIVYAASVLTETGAKLFGKAALLNREKVREIKQQYWTCDCTEALKDVQYTISYPLEKGIASTAEWYLSNHWL